MPIWMGVMVGGALGALVRFLLNGWINARLLGSAWTGFPLGTLVINVTGSFLLSFLLALVVAGLAPPSWRSTLGSGFLGAYTTFSTFASESDALLREGKPGVLALYLLGNLLLGYGGVLLGRLVAARLSGVA